jgi:glycosyltransferase involved in cell wall biosynthesis
VKKLNDCGFNVKLNIFGVGPEELKLKKLVSKLNIGSSVIFNGWVGRNKLPEKFRGTDIFIMPSSPETFGLVYLEAMASGCVILGHKGEGIDGIVTDEVDALMVASADSELIVEKIKWFANLTPIQRLKIKEKSVAIAEKYDMNSASRNYYESLLAVVRKTSRAREDY